MMRNRWSGALTCLVKDALNRSRIPSQQLSTQAFRQSHYQVLGVAEDASEAEIKSAFFNLSKKYHPDKSNSKDAHKRFVRINEAYSVLSKPISRRQYDDSRGGGIRGFNPYSTRPPWAPNPYEDRWSGYAYPPPFKRRPGPRKPKMTARPGETGEELYERWYQTNFGPEAHHRRARRQDPIYYHDRPMPGLSKAVAKILIRTMLIVGTVVIGILTLNREREPTVEEILRAQRYSGRWEDFDKDEPYSPRKKS